MERVIDVTIEVDEATGIASVSFFENQSGDHFRIKDIEKLDGDMAKRVGFEIIGWIDDMRERIEEERR